MTQALRPQFTQELTNHLLSSHPVILIGPHGQGRRRTVADLRALIGDQLQQIYIDLRNYCHDFDSLIDELCRCSKAGGRSDDALLTALSEKKHIIIQHNFDAIRTAEAARSGYSHPFLTLLQQLNCSSSITLLLVCEEEYDALLLDENGNALPSSNRDQLLADAAVMTIPPLRRDEIVAELQRYGIEVASSKIDAVIQSPAPYSELSRLVSKHTL